MCCAAVANCFAAFSLAAANWRSWAWLSAVEEFAFDVIRVFVLRVTTVVLICGVRCLDSVFVSNDSGSIFGSLIAGDRKSTRLNSSHANISYAVFCLKKKKKDKIYIH